MYNKSRQRLKRTFKKLAQKLLTTSWSNGTWWIDSPSSGKKQYHWTCDNTMLITFGSSLVYTHCLHEMDEILIPVLSQIIKLINKIETFK